MRTSETVKDLVTALATAQSEFPRITKDSENPFYRSRYADMASIVNAVQDTLGKQGLAVTQHLETEFQSYFDEDGTIKGEKLLLCVITRLEHVSGQFEESILRVPLLDTKPQTLGSASTYVRRYALQSILRLAAEDDDGNAASLNANWKDKERDSYVKDKTAALKKDIDEQNAAAAKAKLKKQLQDSVDQLVEAKRMDDAKPQPEAEKKREDPGLISEAQLKMVWAIANKRGLSDGEVRESVGAIGYESLRELPRSQVRSLLNSIDPDFKYHVRE